MELINSAILARVSTTDQKDNGTSLDTQRDGCLTKAKELGWAVNPEHVIEEDWTGKDLQRPGMLKIFELAKSGQIQGVIIYTLDRLYRPENDGDEWRVFEVLQQLQEAGVKVAWVDEAIPTKGPLASVFTFLDAWRSGRERRAIVERTQRGRQEKARRGKVVSRASAPYGYRFDPATSTLVVQDEEAKVVQMAFQLYQSERLSLVGLADRLNRMDIPRSRQARRWYVGTLGGMLSNEAYAGTLYQHRWHDEKVPVWPGEKPHYHHIELPREQQVETRVPAIIPRELFEATQQRLAENAHFANRNARHEYLLSGLLTHACGRRMGARIMNGNTFYYCYGTNRSQAPINSKGEPQPCKCYWVNARDLETVVWNELTNLFQHPEVLMRELEKLTHAKSVTRKSLEEELARINQRLKEIPQEQQKLAEGYAKGYYPDKTMQTQSGKLKVDLSKATERQRELTRQLAALDRAREYRKQVKQLVSRLNHNMTNPSFEKRREIIKLLVEDIRFDDGRVKIKAIVPLADRQLYPVADQPQYRDGMMKGVASRGNIQGIGIAGGEACIMRE